MQGPAKFEPVDFVFTFFVCCFVSQDRPDITVMVDWVLKINYLFCLSGSPWYNRHGWLGVKINHLSCLSGTWSSWFPCITWLGYSSHKQKHWQQCYRPWCWRKSSYILPRQWELHILNSSPEEPDEHLTSTLCFWHSLCHRCQCNNLKTKINCHKTTCSACQTTNTEVLQSHTFVG